MGCEGYNAIAKVYDRLNADLDYPAWADFFEECFRRHAKEKPELVLDLACGTGSMTLELAKRGYDMIGIDGSAEMLNVGFDRNGGKYNILWLLQDMRAFELYGTVGAVTCCLDSLNYLLSPEDLQKTFATVHNYLDPDGLFLFDMNTPYKFANTYGDNAYILEDELVWDEGTEEEERAAVFCGWQNRFDPQSRICDFYLSLFCENADGSYHREEEHQQERMYTMEEITSLLERAGFECLGVWQNFAFSPVTDDTQRWYFCARAKK